MDCRVPQLIGSNELCLIIALFQVEMMDEGILLAAKAIILQQMSTGDKILTEADDRIRALEKVVDALNKKIDTLIEKLGWNYDQRFFDVFFVKMGAMKKSSNNRSPKENVIPKEVVQSVCLKQKKSWGFFRLDFFRGTKQCILSTLVMLWMVLHLVASKLKYVKAFILRLPRAVAAWTDVAGRAEAKSEALAQHRSAILIV